MADYTEEFLKLYKDIAYRLSFSDILGQIEDISKFCLQLRNVELISESECSSVLISSDNNALRGAALFRIIFCKDVDWTQPGFLVALKNTKPSIADYAVITILEVYNEILDKVLEGDVSHPINWGPDSDKTFGDDSVDWTILKIAFQLALPGLLRSIPTKRQFCQNLFRKRIIRESEIDRLKISCDMEFVNLLKEEDGEVVYSALPMQFLNAYSRSSRDKASSYVTRKIMHHKPKTGVWKKVAIFGGLALASVGIGVASVLLFPVAVAGLGFGAGGIVAGSAAASFMASYGGAVSAGSLCALLQSVGAAGLSAGASVGIGAGTGGISFTIMSTIAALVKKFRNNNVSRLFMS